MSFSEVRAINTSTGQVSWPSGSGKIFLNASSKLCWKYVALIAIPLGTAEDELVNSKRNKKR